MLLKEIAEIVKDSYDGVAIVPVLIRNAQVISTTSGGGYMLPAETTNHIFVGRFVNVQNGNLVAMRFGGFDFSCELTQDGVYTFAVATVQGGNASFVGYRISF